MRFAYVASRDLQGPLRTKASPRISWSTLASAPKPWHFEQVNSELRGWEHVIAVEDNGIGFDPGNIRVPGWARHLQADNGRTRRMDLGTQSPEKTLPSISRCRWSSQPWPLPWPCSGLIEESAADALRSDLYPPHPVSVAVAQTSSSAGRRGKIFRQG